MQAPLSVLCFILGFIALVWLNHWRRKHEGDELVYLEQVKNGPKNLPDHARWAIYRDKPLDAAPPPASDLLEGAVAIGDYESAVEILNAMSDEELRRPEVMRQRITLAKATGKHDLARRLEAESDRRS